MKVLLLLVAILFIPVTKADISNSISVKKISNKLHLLKGIEYSTSIGLVSTDDGLVLIDPMPGKTQLNELQRVIREIYNQPVTYILNTHAHEDHSGGNAFFEKHGGKFLNSDFSIEGIKKITVRSHSSQDNIYYLKESNSIFVGDVFDSSWHPTFYSGGLKGFNAAVDSILDLGNENTMIIPGHGDPANKNSLRDFRKNTFEWVKNIRELYLNGLSVEDIMKNSQTIEMLNKFNTKSKPSFIPEKAYRRFVESTIVIVNKEEPHVIRQ